MRLTLIGAVIVVLRLVGVGFAADDSLIFSDNFATYQAAWGKPSDVFWVENNRLWARPEPNSTYSKFNTQLTVGDADIRVKICLADGGLDRSAGIMFWVADFEHSYAAIIKSDGCVDVIRRSDDVPLVINSQKVQPAVKLGLGQVNELRVVTKGPWAAVYVNDQRIWTFRGFPPPGGSRFGLRASSGVDRPYTWQFSDLVVRKTDPALLPATAAAVDPAILYADDFTIFDAGWGEPDERMWVGGNRMNMRPALNGFYMELYAGTYFTDGDIRVKVRAADGGLYGPAGVMFWATDFKNNYRVLIEPDGELAVIRRVAGERQFILDWTEHPAVNRGIGAVNEIRVVTLGTWAAVFVNDHPVLTFQGDPPGSSRLIGLIANSGEDFVTTWQFFDLLVRKPDESLLRDAVLYTADFSQPDSGWGEDNNQRYLQNGDFVLRPKRNMSYAQTFQGLSFRDVDVRAMVCQVAGETDKTAGVMFWATDFHTCYLAHLRPDGRVGVSRSINDRWLNIGPWNQQPAVKQGIGQWNELRVVTRGNWAAVYVNDEFVCKLRGFPPDGPSYVGLHADSGAEIYTWAFANFVVRKPDESLLPPPAPWSATDPTVLFADRFAALDPSWGTANDQLRTERSGLIIEAAAERSYTSLYQGSFFGDCDIRTTVSQLRGGGDRHAGIVFWAADYANYYAAHFRSDGTFDVCRKKAGEWQNVLPPKTVESIKRGLNEENELRVVLRGTAATIFINGARVAALEGELPQGGGMIGLHGESGAAPYSFKFSNFSVREPATESSSDKIEDTVAPTAPAADGTVVPQAVADLADAWLKGGSKPAFSSDKDRRGSRVECVWQGTATATDAAGKFWAATVAGPRCSSGDYLAIGRADNGAPLNVRLTCGPPTELLELFTPQFDSWAQSELSLAKECDDVKLTVTAAQPDVRLKLYLFKVVPPIGILP